MSYFTPAQKRAYAIKMDKQRENREKAANIKKLSSKKKRTYSSNYVPKSYVRKKGFGERVGAFIGEGADHIWDNATKAWDDLGKPIAQAAVMGFGDYVKPSYDIRRNSLLGMGNDPPAIKNAKDGSFIVRHREYLQDIITGTPGQFINTSYKIQPGNQDSFPWLSIVAQSFEQYQLRGMIFEFKSTSADALSSTNTALGEVIMATEYDCKKPNFSSKTQMENHQYAVAARQSCSMLHPIECAPSVSTLKTLYVRTGAVPEGADQHMYDFGNFQIATVGQQGTNVNIGSLWVTYEVRLLKNKMPNVGNLLYSSFYTQTANVCSAANFFGASSNPSSIQYSSNNTIGMRLNATSMDFPSYIGNGTYFVSIQWDGTGAICAPPTPSPIAGSGITMGTTINPAGNQFAPSSGDVSAVLQLSFVVYLGDNIPGTPRRVTFSGGTLPLSCTATMFITSFQTGMSIDTLVTGYTVPFEFNVLSSSILSVPKGPMQVMSEQASVRAEIQRLRAVLKEDVDALEEFEEEEEDEKGEKEEVDVVPTELQEALIRQHQLSPDKAKIVLEEWNKNKTKALVKTPVTHISK